MIYCTMLYDNMIYNLQLNYAQLANPRSPSPATHPAAPSTRSRRRVPAPGGLPYIHMLYNACYTHVTCI